jgi:hypothetical protein
MIGLKQVHCGILNHVFRRRAGLLCATPLHFSTDFDQTFTEALSSSALAHIFGFCDWIIFDLIMALYFFVGFFPYTEYKENTSSVRNFSYISQGILFKLLQKLFRQMP